MKKGPGLGFLFVTGFALLFCSWTAAAANGELLRTINAKNNALKAEISFASDFEAKSFMLDNPPRFVVDIEPALLPGGGKPGGISYDVNSKGVKSVRLAQNNRDPDRVRLVFDLKSANAGLALEHDRKANRLYIMEPGADSNGKSPAAHGSLTVGNPAVSKSAKSTVLTFDVSAKSTDFTVSASQGEGYGQKIKILFPGYQHKGGDMDIKAGVVDSLSWTSAGDGTAAVITTHTPVSYKIEKDGRSGELAVRLNQPAVSGAHICVDAGHGGKDSGTVGFDGTTEKATVLDISLRLRDMLQAAGVRVTTTRDRDYYLTLDERTTLANRSGCQYFISIHGNALPDHGNKSDRRGSQSYYYADQSKDFAAAMLKEMVHMMGVGDMGLYERKFYVIRHTKMKSVLVEIAFLSDRKDLALLKTPEFRENAARSLYNGLEVYLGLNGARMKPVALPAQVAQYVPAQPLFISSDARARFTDIPQDLREEPETYVQVQPARHDIPAPTAWEPEIRVTSLPPAQDTAARPEILVRHTMPAPLGDDSAAYKPRLRQGTALYPKEPWNFKRDYSRPVSAATQ